MNHFPDRLRVFQECQRVLRPGGRAVFTDPVNERFIDTAGLHLLQKEDVTDNAAQVSGRWQRARHRHCEALIAIEGDERFEGLQKFFGAVHRLTSERRRSRCVYLVEKRAD
jgi:SAM-dependent methyltransferase